MTHKKKDPLVRFISSTWFSTLREESYSLMVLVIMVNSEQPNSQSRNSLTLCSIRSTQQSLFPLSSGFTSLSSYLSNPRSPPPKSPLTLTTSAPPQTASFSWIVCFSKLQQQRSLNQDVMNVVCWSMSTRRRTWALRLTLLLK